MNDTTLEQFARLITIMDELREKCPWDRKQTMQSLRHLTIEETYELADAIMEDDLEEVKKELGDLLLHVVFYSKIGKEREAFTLEEVIDGICEKLIARHPHIYGDVEVADEEEVKENWEKIKLKEGKKSLFEGVPVSLPALVKAIRIQDKARGVGFDWEHRDQVWEKVKEEMGELQEEVASDSARKEDELGDLLFAVVNYARFIDVNPEDALEKTNRKFIQRFNIMETKVKEEGKDLANMTLEEMDKYWDKAKESE